MHANSKELFFGSIDQENKIKFNHIFKSKENPNGYERPNAPDSNTRRIFEKFFRGTKVKELTYDKDQAETKSKLTAALEKITYLEEALKEANKTLDAERAARIEIASKTAQPVVNVNGK